MCIFFLVYILNLGRLEISGCSASRLTNVFKVKVSRGIMLGHIAFEKDIIILADVISWDNDIGKSIL